MTPTDFSIALTARFEGPLTVSLRGERLTAANLPAMSALYEAAREASYLGASEFPYGIVRDLNGDYVATISYNGKVWLGEPGAKECVYDPAWARADAARADFAASSIQGTFSVIA